MPEFSVIIPTFNRAGFITKAVESVLRQSFKDFEVIVIDDGSTDDTRAVLEHYRKEIQILHQKNSGVSAARNAGVRQAKGDWIAFLDSDDEWLEDYLRVQAGNIAQFPRAVGHIAGAVTVFQDGTRSEHFREIGFLRKFCSEERLILERPFRAIIGHSHWFLQPTVIRRDFLMKTGLFKTHLSIAEDLDVISKCALMGPFSFSRKVLVEIYRREEAIENLALQRVKKGLYTGRAFGEVYQSMLSSGDLTVQEKKATAAVLSQILRGTGNLLLGEGKKAEARKDYGRAFLLQPSIRSLIKYSSTYLPSSTWTFFIRKGKHILPKEE